jgi:hypothetical protein
MGRKSNVDWHKIKNDYVLGIEKDGERFYPSTPYLSQLYNINPNTVAQRCRREKWQTEKQIVCTKLNKNVQEKKIEQISSDGVAFDLKSFRGAEDNQSIILEILADKSIKLSDRCMLTKALKDNQAYAKEALGEGIVQEDQKITIEIVK